jgi:HAD superfamily hydrolase (TIGR01509 family)
MSHLNKPERDMIKGVLFDMDGVLVDSEEYICQAAIKMFDRKGLKVQPNDFTPFVGKGENEYLGGVAKKHNLDINIEEAKKITYSIYAEIVEGKLEALPGVRSFIEKARSKGLKMAVATSADKVKMEVNLRNISLSEDTFDATVNGLEVERKKPFPDIFLKAAEKLSLAPSECLVVEDAISGIEAAKKAGCRCLALTTSFKKEELNKADWISNTLEDAPGECLEW